MVFISLDKQVYIYSMDTSDFYNEKEERIHNQLKFYYRFKSVLKKTIKKKEEKLDKIKDDKKMSKEELAIKHLKDQLQRKNKIISNYKDKLYELFQGHNGIRTLKDKSFKKSKIISIFDSVLTRTLKIKEDSVSKDIIVVQTFFFDVLKDLIKDGFLYNGEKYICFTASAGQIRTKKTVFIKESLWNEHRNSLTCGLSVDHINSQGGVNINKFLAYLALSNSATDEWRNFDIDKAIVVDDLETNVYCEVDYIDDKTYTIERKTMNIPIEHTDGAGMILPNRTKKSKKAFMIRLPWVKGLLVPFDFKKFINKHEEASTKIKDIYGDVWDVEKDGIEIIFTKSQFKMWKYYSNWKEYKDNFKKYNCKAAKCNEEEDVFADAKFNYQMLQTLTDITNEELKKIASDTVEDILSVGSDKDTMLRVLGVTKSNKKMNYKQKALSIYPELLNDTYSKEIIKSKKKAMVKEARAGKLSVDGKYTFICPDMYAFCERLFLHKEEPEGLLKNGEVFCKLYEEKDKLDCLRSPHLYREHAIRNNVVDDEKREWFITNGIYTSIHDPISRILQFDVDGDKSLVCADDTIIEVAERNMNNDDIVPLYYEMAVANKEKITNENIYNGLITAYTGGNIGIISNDISKIWNSENYNLDVVKWLCMENNFVIDYAKTLYKPKRPDEVNKKIHKFTKYKTPHFFKYAKDKDNDEVEEINDSAVNRLESIIPNKRIYFTKVAGEFDYKNLKRNKSRLIKEEDQELIERYEELDKNKNKMINEVEETRPNKEMYVYKYIRNELLEINSDLVDVTDVLVEYLYNKKNSNFKLTLWSSFGDVIYKNIKRNIKGTKQCEDCKTRIKATNNSTKVCKRCGKERERKRKRIYHQ